MNDYKLIVAKALHEQLKHALDEEAIYHLLEVPKYAHLGDLAFPCFTLAKALRQAPHHISQGLVPSITSPYIDKVEAVGPYVNIFLNRQVVSQEILSIIKEQGTHYGDLTIGQGKNVTFDMSSPNIAKPMSMGHLRSTVIGASLSNIYKKIGYNTININHLGDWGTQFGKLIVAYKRWGNEDVVKADPVNELVKLYVEFHAQAEEHPELEDEARAIFKRLEDGDSEMVTLWQWFKDESIKEFEKVYSMLDVHFDYYTGEAFYNDKMAEHIEYLEKHHISEVDNNATIVRLDEEELPPALIKKSDGATLYLTRDIATAYYRHRTYDFVKSVYVVGNEQANHFKQLKAVLKKMGNDWSDDMVHVAFGLITINGRKMSTRKGEIILLEDVLNDATELALEQIELKNPNLANKKEVAAQVGIGAVVFHDLKNDRMNSFNFNVDEVVQFEGETGPYIQYSRVRALSILRKATMENLQTDTLSLVDDYAWDVIKMLREFPQAIERASKLYEPSVLSKYVIQLAQSFNKYYANSTVLADDKEKYARLVLVQAVADVLKEGLRLLSIKAPDEM
ncbi:MULTISPECIES: arginine--tRNA ligase [unclassified Granulicatella]|uniref:arginine--tRNA ligase n=1 Tax=unclassified Granulicatella TaxID=2630493 RepID=UPI001073832B|nr:MULTISPECIES: arginine--tRNA ligase [unclassified Granulicatella]MBF0780174.1 arginine--tRNA ligase [Granulicatella sp. 19428wC4_WM01]TFU95725.1 arginine--tRNA ligase [Granulicatella sp. WM01]